MQATAIGATRRQNHHAPTARGQAGPSAPRHLPPAAAAAMSPPALLLAQKPADGPTPIYARQETQPLVRRLSSHEAAHCGSSSSSVLPRTLPVHVMTRTSHAKTANDGDAAMVHGGSVGSAAVSASAGAMRALSPSPTTTTAKAAAIATRVRAAAADACPAKLTVLSVEAEAEGHPVVWQNPLSLRCGGGPGDLISMQGGRDYMQFVSAGVPTGHQQIRNPSMPPPPPLPGKPSPILISEPLSNQGSNPNQR